MARVILTGSGLLSLLLAGRCLGHCPVAPYMRPCCSNCLGLLVAWVTLTDSGLLTRRTARCLGLCPLTPVVAFLRDGLCLRMSPIILTGIGLHSVFRTGGVLRYLSGIPVMAQGCYLLCLSMARVILTGPGLLSLLLAGRCRGHCPVAPVVVSCCSNCLGLLVAWVTLTGSGLLTRRTARRLGLCPLAPVVAFLRDGLRLRMGSVILTGIGLHSVFRTGGVLRYLSGIPVMAQGCYLLCLSMARVILTGPGLLSLLLAGRCRGHCPVAPVVVSCCSNCLGLLVAWVTLTGSGLLTRRTARRLGLCPLAPVVAQGWNFLCLGMSHVSLTGPGLFALALAGCRLGHCPVAPVMAARTRVGNSPTLHCKVQCNIDHGGATSTTNYILIFYYSSTCRIPCYFSIFVCCTGHINNLIGIDMCINGKTCRRIRYFHRSALRTPTFCHLVSNFFICRQV